MFEEALVCMHCGRPVDGQVYCSDECESLDTVSPSISTTSSAYPSPYIHCVQSGNSSDVPALVPSALGRSLAAYKTHRPHLSVSSSSASSVAWSALTDDEDAVSAAGDNRSDALGEVGSAKLAGSYGHLLQVQPDLAYVRRPSSTNNRSTVPLLHRRTSSNSDALVVPHIVGVPRSAPVPYLCADDDLSDAPSVSFSSISSDRSPSEDIAPEGSEYGSEFSTVSAKPKRNRASLPAYFSLLQSSHNTSPSTRSRRSPPALQTLLALSRSLYTSPTTPRLAQPTLDLTHAHAEAASQSVVPEGTPRGRGRRRDPDARSASSRSGGRSPPRQAQTSSQQAPASPPAIRHHQAQLSAQARARLNSVEKVFDWVSSSPVVGPSLRGRTITRRNSSSAAKPNCEVLADPSIGSGAVSDLYATSLQHAIVDDDEDERRSRSRTRGRRRGDELARPSTGLAGRAAPGQGNGRSGLKMRQPPRERVRAAEM